jgi:hypothetical protein
MPRCRYSRDREDLFRSVRERLHLRNRAERNGASAKDITARDGKRGGKKDGGMSVEHANAVIAS